MNTALKNQDVVLELEEQKTHQAPAVIHSGPVAAPTPSSILQMAVERGADIDQLTKLLDLKQRYEADEARKAFTLAMTQFKENPPEIIKDKLVDFPSKGGRTTYYHATLASVVEAAIRGLAGVGISHRWEVKQGGGIVAVTCILTHRLGHSEAVSMEAGHDNSGGKNSIQAVASSVTYLQRYTLLSITGLATKDQDDDGGRHKDPVPDWGDTFLESINAAKDKVELQAAWSTAAGACRRKGQEGRPVYDDLKLRVEERLAQEFGQVGAGVSAK
jgi:hypothetical protein